jgi:hypothetical protein
MPCHAMHPIQDLFFKSFSYELQFDMHFYMHSYLHKSFLFLLKVGVTPEEQRCRWKPEVGVDALVGRTGLKGRAERASFGGSEGETKMGRATKWVESQGGCSINSFFFFEF